MHGYQLYIHVGQDDYGSQALIRLDTNLVLRSDGTMQDTKNAYCASIADLHETDPVKLFDAVNKCFKTTTREKQQLMPWKTPCIPSKNARAKP